MLGLGPGVNEELEPPTWMLIGGWLLATEGRVRPLTVSVFCFLDKFMFTTFLFELREEWLNLFFLFLLCIIKSDFATKEEKGAWEAPVIRFLQVGLLKPRRTILDQQIS